MESLLYFLLWAALIFLMMRYGCGAHVMGHGHGSSHRSGDGSRGSENLRWVPPETDIDPVCGMRVDTAKGKSSVHDGHVYYFCSQDCRDKFEANPGRYNESTVTNSPTMEHSHEH